jgi:hypothetical protein
MYYSPDTEITGTERIKPFALGSLSVVALSWQYLGYKQFSRHCDIFKDFRLET